MTGHNSRAKPDDLRGICKDQSPEISEKYRFPRFVKTRGLDFENKDKQLAIGTSISSTRSGLRKEESCIL